MKKTVIALAVAASAVVSGSAMAASWQQGGSGGSVSLGGTLSLENTGSNLWDVMVGDSVTGLDATVVEGQTTVSIEVGSVIPVLGIRNHDADGFNGNKGIHPLIDYDGAFDLDSMSNGQGALSLDVMSGTNKIGTLSTKLLVAAQANNGKSHNAMLYAASNSYVFYGGLAKTASGSWNSSSAYDWAISVFPGIADTWSNANQTLSDSAAQYGLKSSGYIYRAYYASGIDSGQTITITLDDAVTGDSSIEWNASLPITVTYS